MEIVSAGYDETGNIEGHEILGLRAGRRVAIDQAAKQRGDGQQILCLVEGDIGFGERFGIADRLAPGPAARIGGKILVMAANQIDDGLQPVFLDKGEMAGKALMAADPVFRSPNRPVMHHRQGTLRKRDAKGGYRTAPHAATHDVGFFNP